LVNLVDGTGAARLGHERVIHQPDIGAKIEFDDHPPYPPPASYRMKLIFCQTSLEKKSRGDRQTRRAIDRN